jgi:hypothetical protein
MKKSSPNSSLCGHGLFGFFVFALALLLFWNTSFDLVAHGQVISAMNDLSMRDGFVAKDVYLMSYTLLGAELILALLASIFVMAQKKMLVRLFGFVMFLALLGNVWASSYLYYDGFYNYPQSTVATASFNDQDYGISLRYPSHWISRSSQGDGFSFRISNQEIPDGTSCAEPLAAMSISVQDTEIEYFDDWFASKYDEGGGLGTFSGDFEKTTLDGYPAYHVDNFGQESYCPVSGYVVDYGGGRILEIGLAQNPSMPSPELREILSSLELTGYKAY